MRLRAPALALFTHTSARTCPGERVVDRWRPPSRRLHEPERRLRGVARPRDRWRLRRQAEVRQDGDHRAALLDVADDAPPPATRAREDVLQENSLEQGGPVDADALRAHD